MKSIVDEPRKPRRKWKFAEYIKRPIKRYLRAMGIAEAINEQFADEVTRQMYRQQNDFWCTMNDFVCKWYKNGIINFNDFCIIIECAYIIHPIVSTHN